MTPTLHQVETEDPLVLAKKIEDEILPNKGLVYFICEDGYVQNTGHHIIAVVGLNYPPPGSSDPNAIAFYHFSYGKWNMQGPDSEADFTKGLNAIILVS